MGEIKEFAIGEEGVIDGVRVKCVEKDGCYGCAFAIADQSCMKLACQGSRSDGKSVQYQEVK